MVTSNIGVLLSERGLSIVETSAATGISKTTLSSFVNGHANGIKFDTIDKLCSFLDVMPNDLLLICPYNMDVKALLQNEQLAVSLLVVYRGTASWAEHEAAEEPSGMVYKLTGTLKTVNNTCNIKLEWKKPELPDVARNEALSFMQCYSDLTASMKTAAKRKITACLMDVMKNFKSVENIAVSWEFPRQISDYLLRTAVGERFLT